MDEQQDLAQLQIALSQMTLAYEQASQLNQLKGGFLARTSHELRAPISSMMGLHQLILSDLCESPEEERDFVRQAHESAQQLLKLLDEILYIAKLDYGTNQVHTHPLSLQTALAGIHRLTHLVALNRGYGLTLTEPEPDCYVMADEKKFIQALASLVNTAIATIKEGEITITVEPEPETVSLLITITSGQTIWELGDQEEPWILVQPDQPQDAPPPLPSPAMALTLSTKLIHHMGGSLTLCATPAQGDAFTQIRCQMLRAEPLIDLDFETLG
ncbi:HAMP domain-containing sensor histidine kinase [Spirulina sp. CCNP1310]|uniref:sensor histidine kinase n=1 Tax=Spirulina sp. CCNP1310 TaxID=3110249 RepID=UPI002B21901D|nr:HAMP domain-containing sensor histidine kinase [Spirulina sp. CCNP1310]MEA5419749.1 HAMP domain-containing sensor histidine kinase [Spirulina sp. CCNP1310]